MTFRSDLATPEPGGVRFAFIDESGVLATTERSGQFFVVVAVTTYAPKAMIRRLKRQKAGLMRAGWPRAVEIKGNALWRSAHDSRVPAHIGKNGTALLVEMIGEICTAPIWVRYAVLDKEQTRSDPQLATETSFEATVATLLDVDRRQYPAAHSFICVDQRSKEPKDHQRFRQAIERASSGDLTEANLAIEHLDSRRSVGLQAVDILAWAIYRAHEHRDARFLGAIPAAKLVKHDWISR